MYLAVQEHLLLAALVVGPWTWLASSLTTDSVSAVPSLSECNGRGYRYANSSDACICDAPYAGDECQHCARGFYGAPTIRGGSTSVCYLPCSGESRLLHNFTSAGVGVPASWLSRRPTLASQPYCLWVVAPLINKLNSFSQNSESFSPPQFYSSFSSSDILNFNTPPPENFHISLQFNGSQSSLCYDETVLIYSGLPEFLTPFSNSPLTPFSLNTVVEEGSLVGAFTGSQLRDHSLSLSSSILTVVYYSSTTPLSQVQGFNLMMTVELPSGENDTAISVNATSEQEAAAAACGMTSDSTPYDITTNNQSTSAYLSTLVPSPLNLPTIYEEEEEENNSSVPDHTICPGRHLHTSVYDPLSDSLWIFGGRESSGRLCDSGLAVVNLSLALALRLARSGNDSSKMIGEEGGEEGGEGEGGEGLVRSVVVSSEEDGPTPRLFHAAALLPCQQGSCNGSQMLVFGGFTSRLVTSRELWLYDGESEQWTQLESAPVGLAGHTATLTPDGRLVVVGGVNGNLYLSPSTLLYHVLNNTWELIPIRTLGLPGVYGHSAVYDAATNSVLVFGGYMYTRPQAEVSSSLYALSMNTLIWRRVQLADEVPSRMFHSMVVVGNLLVIQGGLLTHQNQHGLEGVCPSNDITIIDLSVPPTLCNGRFAITINVSHSSSCGDAEDGLWAHSLVTDGGGEEHIFVVGGLTDSLFSSTDSPLVSLLHLPPFGLSCSLARSSAQCLGIPGCRVCVAPDDQSNGFISCYNVSANDDSNATLRCASLGGVLLIENNSTCPSTSPLSCEDFQSCGACLSTDIALELGCVWCFCEGRCIAPSNSIVNCPDCAVINSTQPDICFLDSCSIPSSCADCKSQRGCEWLSRRIRANPDVPNRFLVFTSVPEFGCYSTFLHREFLNQLGQDHSVRNCPIPCGAATSCSTCVALSSPTAGDSLTCLWAGYSQECLSSDLVPLACSLGECGPILSTAEQCSSPCVSHSGACEVCLMDPSCVWLSNVANGVPRCVDGRDLRSGAVNQTTNEIVVYLGECSLSIPCREFCHGNSELCIEEGSSNSEFIEWVSRGTGEEGVVCAECGGFSQGRRCEACIDGYFNSSPGTTDVNCRECACNGHDIDDCDPVNGQCSCQNNTRSIPCDGNSDICLTLLQCSLCLPGFSGNPRDNGQCYYNIPISATANFSLPANQTTAFSFGPGSDGYLFSNIDVHAGFVVARSLIDVYISTNPSDVKVNLNRDTWTHRLSFRPGVDFLTKSSPVNLFDGAQARSRSIKSAQARSRSVKSVSEFHGALDESNDISELTKEKEEELSGENGRRVRRAQQLSSLSSAQDLGLYHFVVEERLSLIVPYTQDSFQSSNFYITIFAREDSEFFFYYRQDQLRLNIFVFFSLFMCLFLLLSTVIICAYQLLLFVLRYRRRQRRKERQRRRANRPMVKVVVFFGDKNQATSSQKKKTQPDQELLQIAEGVSADAKVLVVSKDEEGERKGNPIIVISKAETLEKGVNDKDCSKTCCKAGGEIELERREPAAVPPKNDSISEGKKKKKKYQILSKDDIRQWPVGIEPTADEAVCLNTMLIQLPVTSSTNRGGCGQMICMGTALLDYPKTALEDQRKSHERGRKKLRLRRRNRLAPAPQTDTASTNTSQV